MFQTVTTAPCPYLTYCMTLIVPRHLLALWQQGTGTVGSGGWTLVCKQVVLLLGVPFQAHGLLSLLKSGANFEEQNLHNPFILLLSVQGAVAAL